MNLNIKHGAWPVGTAGHTLHERVSKRARELACEDRRADEGKRVRRPHCARCEGLGGPLVCLTPSAEQGTETQRGTRLTQVTGVRVPEWGRIGSGPAPGPAPSLQTVVTYSFGTRSA